MRRLTTEALAASADALLRAIRSPDGGLPGYNVLLTRQFMQIIPRAKEHSGPVAVNALGFAGTLFLRSEEEVEYVQKRGPLNILADVGRPW
jgi:sulfate adenylyltransferase (ADP) / ATP adenylyltransferase